MSRYFNSNELMHYGVLGMKWGVRRYVNEDGTLTAAGKAKYGKKMNSKIWKQQVADAFRQENGMSQTRKVYNKFQKERDATETGKKMKNVNKYLDNVAKQVSAQGGQYFQLDASTAKYVNAVKSKYEMEGRKLYDSKFKDEAAGAALRDLGYEDTRSGRDWITKHGFNRYS